jgi:hypothetical protein
VHDPRFQLLSAGLVAAAAARSWPALAAMGARRRLAVAVLALVAAAPGPAYAVWRLWRQGPVPTTPAAREAYLTATEPGYAALAWLARQPGAAASRVYGLDAPYLAYHAPGSYLGFWRGPHDLIRAFEALADPPAFRTFLGDAGATHLLLVGEPAAAAGWLTTTFETVFVTPQCRLLRVAPPPALGAATGGGPDAPLPAAPSRPPGS